MKVQGRLMHTGGDDGPQVCGVCGAAACRGHTVDVAPRCNCAELRDALAAVEAQPAGRAALIVACPQHGLRMLRDRCARCGAFPGESCDPAKHADHADDLPHGGMPATRCTSEVMRAAAAALIESAIPGAARRDAELFAAELRVRARMIEVLRDLEPLYPHAAVVESCLRAIGEVRS